MQDKTFFREYYPWGVTPTYRLPDGTLEYHFQVYNDETKQFDTEVTTDVARLQALVKEHWQPISYADQSIQRQFLATGTWSSRG